MLNIHDELIADLSRSLTEKRYNPVAAQNNVLYASEFLIYLSEIDLPIEVGVVFHHQNAHELPRVQLVAVYCEPVAAFKTMVLATPPS